MAPTTRRDFIKNSSLLVAGGAVAASTLSIARAAHAYGSDEIKIALVGCGGRGTGAASQALSTQGATKLVALADAFPDRLQAALRGLQGQHDKKVDVPKDRQFDGFDAYRRILETDCDIVLMAAPPGWRPLHFEAAVDAGKHVFMEKPVAVDAAGVRKVLTATEKAKEKGLAVGVGLQRRHEPRYIETIKRLQDGAIGDITCARVYWNGGGVWTRERQPNETEMHYQMRNWYYFNWLCGDHIVEQHIHNIDVINWLKDGYPVTAQGMGGRQVRTGSNHGQIFDHHFVEFTYADGTKMFSQCVHQPGAWNNVSEHAHGTKGYSDISGARIVGADNQAWNYGRGGGDGHMQELVDLFADLREGRTPNEGEYGAKSSMTAIMGRMATYSGQMLKWDDCINCAIVDAPVEKYTSFDDTPPVVPDANGNYPVAMPGITKVL